MPRLTHSAPSYRGDPFANVVVSRCTTGVSVRCDTYERSLSVTVTPEEARALAEALLKIADEPEE